MDSEEESEEAEKSEDESDSEDASLALATEFVSMSIFDHEEKGDSTNTEDFADDYAPTIGVLGTGVPRLACLRPAAWLKEGPA